MLQRGSLRPPPDVARRAIDELDLGAIIEVCKRTYGWSDDEAGEADRWYRNHLWLCYRYPDRNVSVISRRSDLLWHQHILDTLRYREDSDRIFGAFLNHVPLYGGEPTASERVTFQETTDLYVREFQAKPPDPGITSFQPGKPIEEPERIQPPPPRPPGAAPPPRPPGAAPAPERPEDDVE
jgi:hypothetical protein